ncbi:hypothetical protein PROSTU_00517 [Providencia stuartii ATCC 25827]|uniref:Uncharacterized protein n=1 Tax=Providencia stuartii ATCC 25827 TaxID=471874 RepID=A0AA86Z070_PROST|nr:hypothetical protein PROSTU_00517 [Providencia stuartii ATCC 25827]
MSNTYGNKLKNSDWLLPHKSVTLTIKSFFGIRDEYCSTEMSFA